MPKPIDRRSYLKYAGAGVIAAALFGTAAYYAVQPKENNRTTQETLAPQQSTVETRAFQSASTTSTLHRRMKIPESGCYLGAYIGDFPRVEQIGEFERMVGKGLAIINLFYPWEDQGLFPRSELETYAKHGKMPMISWKPVLWDPINRKDIPAIGLQDIIDRKHDEYIEKWAADAKSLGQPLFLRLAWEMNGDWDRHCGPNNFGPNGDKRWNEVDHLYKYYGDPKKPDGPERYIDAWRHVHKVFERAGASNIVWVWSPNYENWPDAEWNRSENYYPGDEYVDWVGVSLYNHGYVDGKTVWRWRSFDTLFQKTEPVKIYDTHKNKPFMLAEYSSAERDNPTAVGDKAQWIKDAFRDIKTKYSAIRAAVWFSADTRARGGNEKDWRVDSSPESLEAYREAVSDAYFLGDMIFET